jgi:23S rRNA (cytosine1962-C5)-methyltransferase
MLHVTVKKGKERKIKAFHPWILKTEILSFSRTPKKGELCLVRDSKGNFLAKGYINPDSYIAVRLLSYKKDEEIDEEFFKRRIRKAFEYRKQVVPENTNAFRIVHSEADYLPGLIVDKYDRYLVVQFTTYGMENLKELIVKALVEVLSPEGIYEKSTVPSRQLEGLELKEELLYGSVPEKVLIKENGITFAVKIVKGQKTGYFLDQRENKLLFATEFVKEGDRVLDAFCHAGGFGIHSAVIGKAGEVVAVDSSSSALELARENAKLNGVEDRFKFVKGDAFDVLREFQKNGEKFDAVVIDPPAFAKRRRWLNRQRGDTRSCF